MHNLHKIDRYALAFETMGNRNLKQAMYNECDVLMSEVLLVLHGEAHIKRRSTELKLFRRDFIRYYLREIYPATVQATLEPFLKTGSMDLLDFARRVNINLSADFAGVDRLMKSTQESEQLARLVRKFGEGATLFHSTRDKDDVRREVADAVAEFDADFFQASKKRRTDALLLVESGQLDAKQLPRDILTILLQNQHELGLDEAGLLREICFFLQAGSHSSGNAMVHAYHDIERWRSAHSDDDKRLKTDKLFVQRCVHESLRLHPASPAAWRAAACPMALPDGKELKEGETLLVDLATANKDPDVFSTDAAEFNPHRAVIGRYPPYGLTFGIGVHTCFGRELAGGEVPKGDNTDSDSHNFGIVTMLIQTLFDAGAMPDANDPPQLDTNTERQNWSYYPVAFNQGQPI